MNMPNCYGATPSSGDCCSNVGNSCPKLNCQSPHMSNSAAAPTTARALGSIACYRFGSLGQDTQLCLWDLTEDIFKQPLGRSRTSILLGNPAPSAGLSSKCCNSTSNHSPGEYRSAFTSHSLPNCVGKESPAAMDATKDGTGNATSKFATLSLSDRKDKFPPQTPTVTTEKEHKRNFSLGSRNSDKNSVIKSNHTKSAGPTLMQDDLLKLIGSPSCPRLEEVPSLEPLVCKKIAHERLTALVFREECIVTACQEGFVCTWARPGKVVSNKECADEHEKNPNVT